MALVGLKRIYVLGYSIALACSAAFAASMELFIPGKEGKEYKSQVRRLSRHGHEARNESEPSESF